MWNDGPIVLRTCPVRDLTPENDYVLGLFRRCYTRRFVPMGPHSWERTAWPDAGGLADQDAWMVEALDYTRDVMNRLEVDLWNEAMEKRTS